ncbi:uncharacterized protein LOC123011203 [Tribolium madens]|uniref:uncharacterized protein LOC123011203 n=1 Tax=Tribolium madens TaxID=41895 RepID=UPI001CF742FC|nr:uncharacterized protein LOC123011203 [Tribolium madens]
MDTTPKTKLKLSSKDSKAKRDIKKETNNSMAPQSPLRKNVQPEGEGEYSPIYFPSTQESNEDIDVLWDWHSPQTSQRKRKTQKRVIPVHSPKIPLKRFPSSNQSQNFEKLKNELKALQEELAMPDDESWLCVSPQQETEFKSSVNSNKFLSQDPQFGDVDDLFNDSLDEQLILQVESELLQKENKAGPSNKTCDSSETQNLNNKYTTKENLSDSFFEDIMDDFSFEDLQKSSLPNESKVPFQRTRSENIFNKTTQNVIQTASGRLEFHRTRSFEMTRQNKCTEEEIERKRLEALAKLESKKKQENSASIKCSREEIERKRLEAMAKLQAKKMQDVIEKKRQEALKKLQMRKQNACQVRSTLATRL